MENFFKKIGIVGGITLAATGSIEAKDAYNLEVNNNQEKGLDELAYANEALAHVGKGPYVSINRPGFISLCEIGGPSKGGSFAHEYVYKVTSWKVTDSPDQLVGGYYVDFVGVGTSAKELDGKSDLEVSVDFNKTNPIGIEYVYTMLRSQGMSPQQIQKAFEEANPKMNTDMLITALKQSEELNKDIAMIESSKKDTEIASNVGNKISQ